MDRQEIKKASPEDLRSLLAIEQEKLRALRFKDSNKQLKNIREIRATKRTIARILTVLNGAAPKK